ncbi:MAG TPA: glycosyltransferase [Desulfobulbaceae bacterium]|nr:glycosyltransferase [Desulfobulbaceae bacterium]
MEFSKDRKMDCQSLADWSCFDRAYCISLIDRADRRENALRQFAAIGLKNVEFHLVERDSDATRSIYESHLACLAKGIKAGAKRFLVFEDDVVFARFSPTFVSKIANFVGSSPDWRVLFLGCMVKKSWPSGFPMIRGIAFQALTHAYAISEEFAIAILRDHPWHGQPYDDFLRDLPQQDFYTLCPAIAFQSNSRSDNKPYLALDFLRRIFGGLTRLQKLNEFFHCHRRLIIAAHILAVITILFLWFQ